MIFQLKFLKIQNIFHKKLAINSADFEKKLLSDKIEDNFDCNGMLQCLNMTSFSFSFSLKFDFNKL